MIRSTLIRQKVTNLLGECFTKFQNKRNFTILHKQFTNKNIVKTSKPSFLCSVNNFYFHEKIRKFSDDSKRDDDSKNKQSSSEDSEDSEIVFLMDVVPRGMPNLFNTIKNFFVVYTQIKPELDPNFDVREFIRGATQVSFTFLIALLNILFLFNFRLLLPFLVILLIINWIILKVWSQKM